MNKITAAITGVEAYVPQYTLTNAMLEKMVDTNDEWIKTRTGISERRILNEPGKASSDLAIPAVKKLLEKKNIDPLDIECVVVGTVTADMLFPSTANIICEKAGLKNAWGF